MFLLKRKIVRECIYIVYTYSIFQSTWLEDMLHEYVVLELIISHISQQNYTYYKLFFKSPLSNNLPSPF